MACPVSGLRSITLVRSSGLSLSSRFPSSSRRLSFCTRTLTICWAISCNRLCDSADSYPIPLLFIIKPIVIKISHLQLEAGSLYQPTQLKHNQQRKETLGECIILFILRCCNSVHQRFLSHLRFSNSSAAFSIEVLTLSQTRATQLYTFCPNASLKFWNAPSIIAFTSYSVWISIRDLISISMCPTNF